MEWSGSVESPETDCGFPYFDLDNNDNETEFFFPSENSHEIPLSWAVPPDNCDDERTCVPQDFYAEDAHINSVSDDKAKKPQSAVNGSAFSRYILGLSSVNHQNISKPAGAHQKPTQQQQQQQPAGPRTQSANRPGEEHVQPCSRCHFFKLRCDGETPCWRCIRKGVGAECCKSPLLKARYVDAPMPWRRDGYTDGGVVENGVLIGPKKPTAIMFMTGMVGKKHGISLPWLDAMVSAIPPKLFQSLTDTVGKLLQMDPSLAKLNPFAITKTVSAAAFDLFPSVAYMKQKFDWEKQTFDVAVNRFLAEFFGAGAHPEEVLDRYARNIMPTFWTEFDLLCSALDDLPLMFGGIPNGTSYMQRFHFNSGFDPASKQCVVQVMRITAKAVYDENGRVQVVEKWMQPSSVDEFDIALDKTPELCRPLQAAVGDRRKGAEIVAMHKLERATESITVMKCSSAMRRKLEDLADAVRDRYAPLVENVVKKRREAAAVKLAALAGSGG